MREQETNFSISIITNFRFSFIGIISELIHLSWATLKSL